MKVSHSARIAFLFLAAFLIHPLQALASTPTYDQCIYALDPTAAGALNLSGAIILNAPGCGVVVDSSSSTALKFSGAGSFTAKYFDVVGGYSTSGAVTLSPKPSTGSAYQANPLTFLVPPVGATCNYTNFKASTGSSTLNPGTYCNGITISGATTVTFNPGTYILMGGGLNVTGASILKGSGVTFFLTQGLGYTYGPLAISGAVVATLSAPTSGSYYGILFYQDPQIGTGKAANTVTGSSASSLSGVLYFPTTALTLSGAESAGNCLILVADTISLTGAAALGNGCSGVSPLQPPAPVTVSVTPATATLHGGQTQQFTASVANSSNKAVTWTITPATGAGAISASGLYTALVSVTSPQTVTVTATSQASTTASGSAAVTLMPKTTPTIAWTTPPAITYGTVLSATQLDATASVAGTFAYTPASGTVLATGSQTLSVTFTPTNTTDYNTASATVALTVNKATPTVTWATPAAIAYGTALSVTQLDATSTVAGTFAYTPAAGTVLPAGSQTLSVAFTPTDAADYSTPAAKTVPLTVSQAALTITASSPTVFYSAAVPTITPSYSGFVNGQTSASLTTQPACTTAYTTTSAAGSSPSTSCSGAVDTNYSIGYVAGTVMVNMATPTVSAWPTASPINYGQTLASSTLSGGTASVSGSFAWTTPSTTPGAGTPSESVTFTPTDTTDYNTPATGSVSVTVSKATPTVSAWPTASTITYGQTLASSTLSGGTASVGGTFAWTTPSTVPGAGTPSESVTFTPTDTTDYNTPATGSVTMTVNKAMPAVSAWPTASTITYGQTLASSTLTGGTASVSGTFAWTTPSTAPGAGTPSESVTFTPTDTTDYNTPAAGSVTVTVTGASSYTLTAAPVSLSVIQGNSGASTIAVTGANGFTGSVTLAASGLPSGVTAAFATNPTTGSSVLTLAASGTAALGAATVTVTGTSGSLTASKTIALTVTTPPCTSSYQRAITIDHTQVPNTDQVNFPFLFSATDPAFATIANGGHMYSPSGNDIVFSADPAGATKLDYELEEYNPATGQVIAWVRIPTLSHTVDTLIYMFYGNSSITTSQQNPAGVWDSNYTAVYHLANVATGTATDSTTNGNNGTLTSILAASGEIDGAAGFDGASSYIQISPADFASYQNNFSASFGAWFKTASAGVILGQDDGTEPSGYSYGYVPALYVDTEGSLRASMFWHGSTSGQIVTTNVYNDNNWHFAVDTYANGTETLYVDGQNVGSQQAAENGYSSSYAYFLGTGYTSGWSGANGGWLYLDGVLDEVSISNLARSSDWIATEYSNQASPAASYLLSPESLDSTPQVTPAAVSLYALQNQQFAMLGVGTCSSVAVDWTINPAVGTISATGLYSLPATISAEQTVTVTATNQANNTFASAPVMLMPSSSGPAGTVLTINGAGFGSVEGASSVTVGGLPAVTLLWSDTRIQAQIPTGTGLGTQDVVVTVGGLAITTTAFDVTSGLVGITPPPAGTTASTTIDTPNQSAPLIFNGTAGQIATIQVSSSTFSQFCNMASIIILNPDGSTLLNGYSCGGDVTPPITLPTTGTYTLAIAPYNNGATGSATVTLWLFQNQVGTITPGIPKTVTINTPGQNEQLTFSGTAGQAATVQMFTSTFSQFCGAASIIILNPDGSTLLNGYSCSGGVTPPIALPATGTYTLVIAPYNNGPTGSATVVLTLTNPNAVTMIASLAPVESLLGSPVAVNLTLKASGGGAPTGTVSCSGSGVTSAAVTVNQNGGATVPMNGLPLGNDAIVCSFASNNLSVFYNAVSSPVSESVIPPPSTGSVSVTPSSAALYGGQVQQFSASVFNASNQAVSWSISPSGTGTISAAGLYDAPASITSLQTVTITATSQAYATQSASATITLSPPQCASSGYGYQRSIVIDHTKVPNTDQADFPFLFNSTDPTFAITANGGHVTSLSGNDIIFSTDPGGLTKLDHELEQYNPVTGQVIAWVRIPNLSHTTDTILYVFYGNPSVTTSQQNPSGVWDSNYAGVYHLANAGGSAALDSTSNGNNATLASVSATSGEIDGAGSFNGVSSYMQIPTADFSSYPASGSTTTGFSASFGIWFNTVSAGVILGQTDGTEPGGTAGQWQPALYVDNAGLLRASLFSHGSVPSQIVTTTAYNDNNWHFAVDTYTNGAEELYVDGQYAGSQQVAEYGYNSSYAYLVGTGETANWPAANEAWLYFNGALDEVNVSNVARSGDWIQTEYSNQSSPSTFYALHPENAEEVIPGAVSLYSSQNQQFTILGSVAGICSSPQVIWSMPSGMPGTLTADGIYTAPNSISSQQTVPITATILGDSTKSISSAITLMPAVALALTPNSVTLSTGQTQQFTASVTNTANTAVTWTIDPVDMGTVNATGLYSPPAGIAAQQIVTITATSQADPTQSASATITLAGTAPFPPVSISVTPSSAALYGDQTQQFTASVTNTYNTAVTWTISPAGLGAISPTGLYTAPATVGTQQTVTITAASQANPTQSASATIGLSPTPCGSNGYSYIRSIAIDHTRVPNSDQTNFPFLFNTTDPSFATTANGGHVTSSSGNDIIFSTDPNGLTTLNYELEEYNPANGQVIAWVNIPTLSHSTDTVLYMFYGNSSITAPQQNPAGVWDSNYGGVWHLSGSGSPQSFPDSTANSNTATAVGSLSITPGQIANSIDVSNGYINAGNNPSVLPAHTGTFSIWTDNYTLKSCNCFYSLMGNGDSWNGVNGTMLSYLSGGSLQFILAGPGGNDTVSDRTLAAGQWYYITGTWNGSTVSLYANGVLVGSTAQTTDASPAYNLNLGLDGAHGYFESYLNAGLDEARVSGIARSADWIAAEYSNQGSPSTFYALSSENGFFISPSTVALNALQSQQFTATSACNAGVTWSMPAGTPGTLTQGGLYTAPATIATQQTVTITATSQGASASTATATVTLMPPVTISIAPGSVTLTSDQTQQFAASVANTYNPAVTWTIMPAGTGAIDADGVYTAPSTISAQQTVTITATSQEDTTKSASAAITLTPTQCASSGYAYQRVIVIDHTKVPNTDQANFPFLFDTTDSDLANTLNGGHVTSPSGYDIIFSTDPNGLTKLDHEFEVYNPVTGQVVAWMRIPTLSHTTDTVIYVFYGNPNVVSSQQNPAGVWNSNYTAVYHLDNPGIGAAADSTANDNSAPLTAVSGASGEIDGAAGFNGVSSYMQIPSADFANYPTGVYDNIGIPNTSTTTTFSASFGVWFKTASAGGILNQTTDQGCYGLACSFKGPMAPGETPVGTDGTLGSWNSMMYVDDNGSVNAAGLVTPNAYNDNNWHFAVATYGTDGTDTLYVDGQNIGSTTGNIAIGYNSAYSYFVGTTDTLQFSEGDWDWLYFNGDVDEVTVSNTPRSGDWVQTEYNNQASPSTFYDFYPRSTVQVTPSAVSLYASQSEQFAVPGSCNAAVTWSMPSGAQGTLTSGGLYTAPEVVTTQQAVTITASNPVGGAVISSAAVTLLPTPSPITLTASAQAPYTTGSSQTFTAAVLDQDGTPEVGVAVTFSVAGANSMIGSGISGSSGIASYTYTGANTGNDTIQAAAVVNGMAISSNSISASWVLPIPANPAANIALLPPASVGIIGLMGAFTDNSGDVIEPIAIGAVPRTFIVPAGATRVQLGVDSSYFAVDGGAGLVVLVNGVSLTVPPTAMPWTWVTGGQNNNYQYGIYDPGISGGIPNGTQPIAAPMTLTPGESVSIAYQSGTASANLPARPLVNADGDQTWITGIQEWQGTYFPTLYTTTSSYPLNQPINFNALVTDASGNPMVSVPVTLNIAGANAQQLQAVTDSTGAAAFLYSGINPGTDSLQAQAFPSGAPSLASSESSVTWTNYPAPPPAAADTLQLSLPGSTGDYQTYYVLAEDGSSPAFDSNVGFFAWGIDNLELGGKTDITGHLKFSYGHVNPGTYNVIAVETDRRNVIFSNVINGVWTPPNTVSPCDGCNIVTVSISAQSTVSLPGNLQLNGTVTDSEGVTPTISWTQISGPGTVTFSTPQQAVTTASFSEPGIYVVQLSANDAAVTASSQFTVQVNPVSVSDVQQGWIGSPLFGSTVSGVVPITLAPGVSLTSGTLTLSPACNPIYTTNNCFNVTTLNPSTTGSGQIGTLDTTTLPNGSYWIQLQATDNSSPAQQQNSLILITVAGNYKPGRVTATVTDLVVPATGLAINIQRTYDSLNAGTSGDFGYGWNLGINVNLTVDPKGNVTFTLGGQRKTFDFTPQQQGCNPFFGCVFPWYFVVFTPEPGLHGALADSAPGCSNGFDLLTADGFCQDGSQFNPPGYIYTDPNGTAYTISAAGNLQSINDRSGNGLTITPTGITSTTGLNVPFVRDASNRITQITDPQGNIYQYGYDANGNLATVTYPNTATPSTYTYNASHYYLSGTDARSNPLPVTAYYDSTTDGGNSSLDGRLLSVTDSFHNTTSYAYTLSAASTINGVTVPNTGITTVTYPDGGTAAMIYDTYGDLLQSTDPLNNITVNAYDANHNLISTTDPLGNTTSSTYDANGNKTSSTYPPTATSHNTTSATLYNQYSEPTSTTDELGNTRAFNYDANYNPQSITDPLGTLASFLFNADQTLAAGAIGFDITSLPAMASQFTYDANGNMASRTDALGRTTSYTYNSLGQKTAMVTPTPASLTGGPASTTTYQYDALGNLTQTAAPLARVTGSAYDANGNKISDTDARGNVTAYVYDPLNRLIETDYPTQPTTKSTKTYDFRNNVVTATDQAGNVTLNAYDLAGRLTSVTRGYGTANASATIYAYDNANRKIGETDALGHTTTYTYDNDSRLVAVSGVKGNMTYAYDDAGNRISMTDGNGHTTNYQYDARKRLVKTVYPDQTTVVNAYDGPGNLASVTDQAGAVVQYAYDAANQLKTVTQLNHPDPSHNTNSYSFDALGNLTGLTDENGHTTLNSFDTLNEPVQKLLPDQTLTETRQYDAAGNLVSLTHFNGVTTTYTYDALNRLVTRSTPGEPPVSFTYTATGKYLTSMAGDGTVNYAYDALDRLTTKATPEGALGYTYYADGQVETITSSNANGASVAYTYDDLNRLSTVVDYNLSGQNTTTYTYDPASNVATVATPNGLTSKFTYDTLNRLTAMNAGTASYSYQLGPTGNRTSATEGNGRTLNWSYDGIYRLTNESISGDPSNNNGSAAYDLDPVGNRLSQTSSLPGINTTGFGTYNADDEVSSESYDANGNTTKEANGNNYTYDSENHMISMTNGSTVVSMIYDALGNRVAKTVNGVTTQYLVDDLNPTGYPQVIEELTGPIGAGVVTRTYTYGLQRISQLLSPAVSGNSTWTPSFYVYDGAGSVRQLTNSAGVVTDEYEYDAFGNSFTRGGTTPNNYLYRGEQYDTDLGLYYLRARYYNPATGRFLSRDPEDGKAKDPASLHKYLYANGDPVNGIDPTGRGDLWETIKVTAYVIWTDYIATKAMVCGVFAAIGLTVKWEANEASHDGNPDLAHFLNQLVVIFGTFVYFCTAWK